MSITLNSITAPPTAAPASLCVGVRDNGGASTNTVSLVCSFFVEYKEVENQLQVNNICLTPLNLNTEYFLGALIKSGLGTRLFAAKLWTFGRFRSGLAFGILKNLA